MPDVSGGGAPAPTVIREGTVMFRLWLQFPAPFILLWLLIFFAVSGAIIHVVCCRSRWSPAIKTSTLAAPYFVSISVLFALFLGFLLANAVSQKNRAFHAVQSEGTALRVLDLHAAAAPSATNAIRGAIRAYAQSAADDEWPRMIEERASPQTEAALLALLRAVGQRSIYDEGGSALHGQMLSLAQKIAEARAERLAIVTSHAQRFAWTALFLLGVLTQLSISIVHLERVQSNVLALSIFSLAAVIALWLVAIQENPFRGRVGVSPAPIASVAALSTS
jgi:hypothetical protein